MKTRKQLEKELETLNYRVISLSDIPNRRTMTTEEEVELENLEIRVNDLRSVLKDKVKERKKIFDSVGRTITLLASIMFLLLTIWSITSAYQFMTSQSSVEKQVIMGTATILTFLLTIGSTYAYTRQYKFQWK